MSIKSACNENELIQWYLEKHEDKWTSETILTEEIKFKKVVKQLIKVMIIVTLLLFG